jgi:hypothetical protein
MTTTPESSTERQSFGWDVGPSEFGSRGIVARPHTSIAGNVILEVGTESPTGTGWFKVAHVVLTPDEAKELQAALGALLG